MSQIAIHHHGGNTGGHFLWMADVARILREGLGADGVRVPTKVLPDYLVYLLSLFMPQLRMFRHDIGQRRDADNTKARAILGFDSRPQPSDGESLTG